MTTKSRYEDVFFKLLPAGWGQVMEEFSEEPLRYHHHPSVATLETFNGRRPYDTMLFNNGDPFLAVANLADSTHARVNHALVEALGAETMPKPDKKSYSLVYGSKTGVDSANIYDLGGGTGSKLVKEYTDPTLARRGLNSYVGPKATIFDVIDDPTRGVYNEWGVNYRYWDAFKEPIPVPPHNTILTSVNFLTNVCSAVLEEVEKYDGVHLVPNCRTMVARGVSIRNGDKINTRIQGLVHEEYYHDFDMDPESGHATSGFYGHLHCFSSRNIDVDPYTRERTIVDESTFPVRLCAKPDRYTTTNNGFYAPFKLKYDGNECMIHMNTHSVVVQKRTNKWVYQASSDHVCHTEIHLFGELVSELKKINPEDPDDDLVELVNTFYPHLVYQAGRRCKDRGLRTFLRKTEFNIPNINVEKEAVRFSNLEEAIMASKNSTNSDGIIALGGVKHVAAKLYETVDVRICHSKVLHKLFQHVYPRSLVVSSIYDPNASCKKQRGCATCPIYEFAIRFNGDMVVLSQIGLGPRRDKLTPNALEKVCKMLPDGKTGRDPATIWDELGDGVVIQLKSKEIQDDIKNNKNLYQARTTDGTARLHPIADLGEATAVQVLDAKATTSIVNNLENN